MNFIMKIFQRNIFYNLTTKTVTLSLSKSDKDDKSDFDKLNLTQYLAHYLSHITLCVGLLLTITITNFAQTSSKQISFRINELLKDKFFESSLASIDVYNLTTQKVIYQKNNKMLLHPASNMKILTSAAALKF